MSGAVERLVQEVIHFGHEIIDNLPHGHGAGHGHHGDDIRRMADEVDDAEQRVARMVPHNPQLPWLPRFGRDGMPGWSPHAHVFSAVRNAAGKYVGNHHRPLGVDHPGTHLDPATRLERPNDIYFSRWMMDDADGFVITRSDGRTPVEKPSTFWPDHWTPSDVEQAVAEAYWHAVPNGSADETGFVGYSGDGHRVRGWFDAQGIVTAFPDYPIDWKMGDPLP